MVAAGGNPKIIVKRFIIPLPISLENQPTQFFIMPKRNSDEGNFLEMTVSNIGFLLDRLGQDCHPLQFLRELTQNSIEAINRRR